MEKKIISFSLILAFGIILLFFSVYAIIDRGTAADTTADTHTDAPSDTTDAEISVTETEADDETTDETETDDTSTDRDTDSGTETDSDEAASDEATSDNTVTDTPPSVTAPTEDTTSPADDTTNPPKEDTTEPPKEVTTKPPKEDTTEPPKEVTTKPPKEDSTEPPEEVTTKPPKEDTTEPPEEVTTKPPKEDTTEPPEEVTTKPPKEDTTEPPKEVTTKPPKEDTTEPPEEVTTKPPKEDTTKPPEEVTTKPPKEDTTKPPKEESTTKKEETTTKKEETTTKKEDTIAPEDTIKEEGDKLEEILKPAEIILLKPVASGTLTKSKGDALIDYSNTDDGYVMVKFGAASSVRLKVQVKGPSTTYTYNLTPKQWEVFPLSDGSGEYKITVFKNVYDNKYSVVVSLTCDVKLTDEFAPFIRPNQYVNYENATNTMNKAASLVAGKKDLLSKVETIYSYVITNIKYDYDKAATVESGYLPDLDKVLKQKKGICFDYAALMAGMLRSQGIACKLVVGYAGDEYHAWISVWSPDKGWVDGAIFFNGTSWKFMDPTFASTVGSAEVEKVKYTTKYIY